jgi:hypothetical protein
MLAAVEDALSEAVVRRAVSAVRPDLVIWQVIRKNGSGYLKSRARELNRTAHQVPVLLLADHDTPEPCPASLIASWLGTSPAPKLLFRVAVMEVESWIMADRRAFAAFMGVPQDAIPENPDAVLRPKELIVALARKSKRRDIREDLVPGHGSTAVVGPAFNARLIEFVAAEWNPAKAAKVSDSLDRAVRRLQAAFR